MLDLVRALEEREEQLARLSRQLVDVQRTAEAVGSGAAEASDVLARLPSARAGSDGELETARTACSDRRAELRQAEEAAASVLGESFAGSSVGVVRQRLERST